MVKEIYPYLHCQNCQGYFVIMPPNRLRKYCSRKCRDAAYYKRQKELFREVAFRTGLNTGLHD